MGYITYIAEGGLNFIRGNLMDQTSIRAELEINFNWGKFYVADFH